MTVKSPLYQIFKLKTISFLSILSTVFLISSTPNLEAGGWGKTEEVIEYDGVTWSGVFFDMNGLNLTASIPNYSGAILQNNNLSLKGHLEEGIDYGIITSFNPSFTPPETIEEFVEMVQNANPNYIVTLVDSTKLGAKYTLDMIPINQHETIFWRFLTTHDRLIKMGTDDSNDQRRLQFFESLYIH